MFAGTISITFSRSSGSSSRAKYEQPAFPAECYSSRMENPTRKADLTSRLTFLFGFFCVLVFCLGAYPANQKVVKEDGIEYSAAESVSDEAFKRARFFVQHMTTESPNIREKWRQSGSSGDYWEDQVLSDLPDYAHLKGKKTRDGLDFDTGTRGAGGREMCSIGEETSCA